MSMLISVTHKPFHSGKVIADFEENAAQAGAIVTFTGIVRDQSAEGGNVTGLFLEHFPGMTERSIEAIVKEARARWKLSAIQIIHRYGTLKPGEAIVLVCAASDHRRDAFEAVDFLMDFLKTKALFWKKEICGDKDVWIEPRENDYQDAERWRSEEEDQS